MLNYFKSFSVMKDDKECCQNETKEIENKEDNCC